MRPSRASSCAFVGSLLIAAGLAGCTSGSLQGVYVVEEADGTTDQVVSLDALPLHPTLSPDDRRIAYMEVDSERSAVVIADRKGSVLARFARSRFPGGEPVAWSPSGQRLAYVHVRTVDRPPYESIELVVADPDGSRPRTVDEAMFWRVISRGPTWSPDGTSVAWAREHDERGEGNLDVDVVDVRSGRSRTVAGDLEDEFDPGWSPDGTALLFVRLGQVGDGETLWFVEPDTLAQRRVTGSYLGIAAAWSPDGTRIAFSGAAPGDETARLYVVQRNGRGLRSIADDVQYSRPAWAPNGSSIAFATEEGIDVVAPDGSGRRTLVEFSPTEVDDLAWSSDGSFLLFFAEPPVEHD